MKDMESDGRSWLRAIGIGLVVSVATAAVMIVATRARISPFPEPPSLAFAETLLGRKLPLPVGLLFHAAYVTFWSAVFVRYFPRRSFMAAMALAGALWLIILVVFFPLNGWGVVGLGVSPLLIPASLVPHLLFGIFLWGSHRWFPGGPKKSETTRYG